MKDRTPIHIEVKGPEDKVDQDIITSEPEINVTINIKKKKSKRPIRFSSPYPIFLGPWGLIFKIGYKFYQIYPEGNYNGYEEEDEANEEEYDQ